MKSIIKTLFCVSCAASVALYSFNAFSADKPLNAKALREEAIEQISTIPAQAPDAENDTPKQITLGEKLYFDTKLSLDNTISCNTCHLIDKNQAGDDGKPISEGVGGAKGTRNSPTVLNSGFLGVQFWDGRAPDLVEQAKGPILNPVEMKMPDEKSVEDKLAKDALYPKEFADAFPDDKPSLTFHNVARAIAAFERTLNTKDRFDEFLDGNDKALKTDELKGLSTFLSKGCASCHTGPLLGGEKFFRVDLNKPYPNKTDLGRFDATQRVSDKYKFRTSPLRNVAITAPYFHDGKVETLEQAVDLMGYARSKQGLSSTEIEEIVIFLKTLTGKGRVKAEVQE
ncbi:MAG: cytochrome-c peroxidase [Verrucomicrobia bacterium]|nr:cytochrome-c peroxidase [Verrucomicrobiota bacterium]